LIIKSVEVLVPRISQIVAHQFCVNQVHHWNKLNANLLTLIFEVFCRSETYQDSRFLLFLWLHVIFINFIRIGFNAEASWMPSNLPLFSAIWSSSWTCWDSGQSFTVSSMGTVTDNAWFADRKWLCLIGFQTSIRRNFLVFSRLPFDQENSVSSIGAWNDILHICYH
jgi:hypothetical protein